MNGIPLHPALVHLPLALAMLVPLLALAATIAIHRKKLPRWVWAGMLGLQLLLVGSGLIAMQTGEEDEERVEELVPEPAIESHEEAAEVFVWSAAAVGALFVLGLAAPRASLRSAAMAGSTVGAFAVAAIALNVGHLGGELVYRHGAASAHQSHDPPGSLDSNSAPELAYGDDDDDDDD